ncbi:YET3 (YDL072C) [Zygosaccharomyces parabailii]|nr:YET3 (YDL072C) [Zygosaccharomyces parabailii]CDH10933.1 related to Endoplasmic reticulum transmembrane protein 3 [Zygosaccharomyces bailii ISA1307]
MSIYYKMVFGVLVTEIVMFSILALPLPTKIRKPLTLMLIRPFLNDVIQVAIKCMLAFVGLLFVDSVNRLYTVQQELEAVNPASSFSGNRMEVLSRKFFAQRNMYLTGITLFLTFVVVRTFNLVRELLQLKDRYQMASPDYDTSGEEKRNAELKRELEAQIAERDAEIQRLQEKAAALEKEI